MGLCRLIDSLNKHKAVQALLVSAIFALYSAYVFAFCMDTFRMADMLVRNSMVMMRDDSLEELFEYELDGNVLKANGKSYSGVSVRFYGIAVDDTSVYFRESDCTMLLPVPGNFGPDFILMSNAHIAAPGLLVCVMALWFVRMDGKFRLECVTKGVCLMAAALLAVLLLAMAAAYLLLL